MLLDITLVSMLLDKGFILKSYSIKDKITAVLWQRRDDDGARLLRVWMYFLLGKSKKNMFFFALRGQRLYGLLLYTHLQAAPNKNAINEFNKHLGYESDCSNSNETFTSRLYFNAAITLNM